jgi:cytochrome P450
MFDPRRVPKPKAFDPDRSSSDYMLFGFGLHWCIGARLAEAQITQTFKPLLQREGLRRESGKAGKLQRLGPFPEHLWVRYEV